MLSPLCTKEKAIKEVNNNFYSFLWNQKGDKIKCNVMINDYSNGGLKMIDIQSFNKSLKAMWIKKYLDPGNQGKWKLFFGLELGKSVEKNALTSNLSQQDTTKTLATKNSFVREMLRENFFLKAYGIILL